MKLIALILTFICFETVASEVASRQHPIIGELHQKLTEWFNDDTKAANYANLASEEYEFAINGLQRKLQIIDESSAYRFKSFDYSPSTYQVFATYEYQTKGTDYIELHLNGHAYPLTQLPVVNSKVLPGRPIESQHVVMQKIRVNNVQNSHITTVDGLVGMIARNILNPFRPISKFQVRPPILVKKGKLVTMRLQTANMEMSIRGKAMSQGAYGDVVSVMNLNSKHIVEGEVIGPQLVKIEGVESFA
jgi:flagella basal body P-ring formation protein FlgA